MYEFIIQVFNPTSSRIHLAQAPLGASKKGQRYPLNFVVSIAKLIKATEQILKNFIFQLKFICNIILY